METIMGEMKSITIDENEIFSGITKIKPEDGDIFIFYIKTDDEGVPLVSATTYGEAFHSVNDLLQKQNKLCGCIFLLDKYYLPFVKNSDEAIRELEEVKSSIEKAIEQVRDIKNRTESTIEKLNILEAGDQINGSSQLDRRIP